MKDKTIVKSGETGRGFDVVQVSMRGNGSIIKAGDVSAKYRDEAPTAFCIDVRR